MVTPDHICPFGTKSKYLLRSQGFDVADHWLCNRQQTDAFKAEHQVQTTPQTFIDGQRIGGYDDLRAYFHKRPRAKKGDVSYTPVVSLFGVAALMAVALRWWTQDPWAMLSLFAGFSMCLLAVQKLRDVESFSNGFLNYDLFAMRFVPYAYVYPFIELLAGLGMLSGLLPRVSATLALIAGLEGGVSVFKAVYVDRRHLKCACVGGDSNVPLGFVSLTENLLMVAMGVWMWL